MLQVYDNLNIDIRHKNFNLSISTFHIIESIGCSPMSKTMY